jgi:hypothetical protein
MRARVSELARAAMAADKSLPLRCVVVGGRRTLGTLIRHESEIRHDFVARTEG